MLSKLFTVVFATAGLTVASMGFAPGVPEDCCGKGLECCKGNRACCSAESKPKCCAEGKECCAKNLACCDSPPQCCVEGKECCDKGLACCDEVAANGVKACCLASSPSPEEE